MTSQQGGSGAHNAGAGRATANRAQLAPFLFEKHLNHQEGIAGTLSIRLVEARNLRPAASLFWVRACNPYMIFRLGKTSVRSQTIVGNSNPSWRKEFLSIKIPKLNLRHQPLADHSDVRMELIIDAMNEDSLTGKATECVGMLNGSLIGSAVVDFTSLLEGQEEVLDRWVTLSDTIGVTSASSSSSSSRTNKKKNNVEKDKGTVLGEVRIILQYEPHGMEPKVGDIVKMEGFGSYPSSILPPIADLEMEVKRTSGSYLLCSYRNSMGFEVNLRLHRYCVFVSHRKSVLDQVYVECIAKPVEFVLSTPLGKSCYEIARPYVQVASTITLPAILAVKTTVFTTVRASTAVLGAIFAGEH